MGGKRKVMEFDGYKGGNTWKGADRKGYRGGRVPVYPPDVVVHRSSFILSDQEYATAVFLGLGNAAKGLRLALKFTGATLKDFPVPIPKTRIEAETLVRPARKRIAAVLSQRLGFSVRAPQAGRRPSDPASTTTPEWDDV